MHKQSTPGCISPPTWPGYEARGEGCISPPTWPGYEARGEGCLSPPTWPGYEARGEGYSLKMADLLLPEILFFLRVKRPACRS